MSFIASSRSIAPVWMAMSIIVLVIARR